MTGGPLKPDDDTKRNVILWSGGMDSTALLHHYARVSSEDYPVLALTVNRHPGLQGKHIQAQNEAQRRYLKFAKSKGYHIKHERMAYSGNFRWHGPTTGRPQPTLWLITLIQVLGDNDVVLMSYWRDGCFWHYREQFVRAFEALCELKGVKAKLEFPFEWHRKSELYSILHCDKVPRDYWFSCDATTTGKPCGKCDKCAEVNRAIQEMKDRAKLGVTEGDCVKKEDL